MNYLELDVWLQSRKLVKEVYLVVDTFPKKEEFILNFQIKRSAISVSSNIAEGCGRKSSKETIQFLFIARGSLYELETQLYLSSDLGYLNEIELMKLLTQIELCKKLLNGFINYFKKK